MEKDVKRQHYVPRTYLKNFSVERKEQYYIKALSVVDCVENNIYETSIANVCVENHLYTLPGDTVEERMLIEKFYSENLETHYSTIFSLLTDPSKKTLTDVERELIISTVVTMFYRTTKWITQHNKFFDTVLDSAYNLAAQNGYDYFTFEGQKVSIAGKTLQELQKEFRFDNRASQITTQLEVALNLIKLRTARDGIMVVKLMDDDCEFITSDNPVIYSNVNGKQLAPFDAENILQLPLDKRHTLLLMPYADDETKYLISRSNRSGNMCYTQKLTSNYSQFLNADKFILGNESSIKGYLATKVETERPLTEEEKMKFDNMEAELNKKWREIDLK